MGIVFAIGFYLIKFFLSYFIGIFVLIFNLLMFLFFLIRRKKGIQINDKVDINLEDEK